MRLLFSKLREISVFLYTLIFLLIFNLYFNLNYSWYGVSLILRVYIFLLSFYLIFIFASIDIDELKNDYLNKYGKKRNILLFIETRVIPFLLIFLITVIFTFIDEIRAVDWPWDPFLKLLNGRYSNNLIYPWLLLVILRLKKKPIITIPLFISLLLIYGSGDKIIYSLIDYSIIISGIKFLKILIFMFFIVFEFINTIPKSAIISLIITICISITNVSIFSTIFKYSEEKSYQKKETGYILLRMGYTYPLEKLTDIVIKLKNYGLLKNLLSLSEKNDIKLKYSKDEWEQLLFSGSVEKADIISGYIINKNIDLQYEKIISFAELKSKDKQNSPENAKNFILLTSQYLSGHEKNLLNRIKSSNKKFKLWGMQVLAENKSIEAIPLLIVYTTDIDETIAEGAYNALKSITEMDPAAAFDKSKNDPDIIEIFKKYYLKYSQK